MIDEYGYSPARGNKKQSYRNTGSNMQVEYDSRGAGFKSPMHGRQGSGGTSTTARGSGSRSRVSRKMGGERIHIEEAPV